MARPRSTININILIMNILKLNYIYIDEQYEYEKDKVGNESNKKNFKKEIEKERIRSKTYMIAT